MSKPIIISELENNKNQNAFSNININGSTTISADNTTDTFALVAGNNITLEADTTNDKITISAANTYELPKATKNSLGGVKVSGTTLSNTTGYTACPVDSNGTIYYKDTDTIYTLPTANLSTLGGVKTTSSITNSSGYTACPIINGVPYYKDTNTTYTLPIASSSALGGVKTGSQITNTNNYTACSIDANGVIYYKDTNTTYDTATESANGLMASKDKKGLNSVINTIQTYGYWDDGVCNTSANTAAKVVDLNQTYSFMNGGIITVKFTYSVPANATLNVNNTGAKNIYYRDAKIVADIIQAGDTVVFLADATNNRYYVKKIEPQTVTANLPLHFSVNNGILSVTYEE
jgi:hypothetical protein